MLMLERPLSHYWTSPLIVRNLELLNPNIFVVENAWCKVLIFLMKLKLIIVNTLFLIQFRNHNALHNTQRSFMVYKQSTYIPDY